MDYENIENAFLFVSGAPPYERSAVINRTTGETFFASSMAGIDEMPGDLDENDDYIGIPHKNDLNLGKPLVMEFVRHRCSEQINGVRAIFSRPGAYGRYKDLLSEINLLEEWFVFENERTREALLEWCRERGIAVEKTTP